MSAASSNPAGARFGTMRVISVVGSLVGVLGVLFVVRTLVQEWDDVSAGLRNAHVGVIVLATVVGAGGMAWIGVQWAAVLTTIGSSSVPLRRVVRAYFIGQLGKYVPGGIWTVLGRAESLVRAGAPRAVAYPSVGLSMVTTYIGAVVLAALAAPFTLSGGNRDHAWALVALPLAAVCIHPRVLGKAVAVGERLFAQGEPIRIPPWQTAAWLVVRHVPAWGLISLATWLVARALDADVNFAVVALATTLSWTAGLVALPVPGGIGVREAVFVALLAGAVDTTAAATIAIVARVVFIASDVTTAGAVSIFVPSTAQSVPEPVS